MPTPILAGSIFTSSLKGSWMRRPMDMAPRKLVLRDELDQLCLGFLPPLRLAHQVDDGLVEQPSEFIQRGQLAAALETGIHRQHAPPAHWRLQQQVAQVASKNLDRAGFSPVG